MRLLLAACAFFALSACAHDPRYEPSKAYVVDVCMERDNPGKCIRQYRADARLADSRHQQEAKEAARAANQGTNRKEMR